MRDEFLIDRQGKKAVLYAGLLDQAHQEGLKAIQTRLLQVPGPENGQTAICHATVETSKGVFEGIGDANPGNVGRMVVGHIIRMAETRAKARALRDAINVGVVSLEELGEDDDTPPPGKSHQRQQPEKPPASKTLAVAEASDLNAELYALLQATNRTQASVDQWFIREFGATWADMGEVLRAAALMGLQETIKAAQERKRQQDTEAHQAAISR